MSAIYSPIYALEVFRLVLVDVFDSQRWRFRKIMSNNSKTIKDIPVNPLNLVSSDESIKERAPV